MRVGEVRIDLEGIAELKRRLVEFALVEVALAAFEVLLLAYFRVQEASVTRPAVMKKVKLRASFDCQFNESSTATPLGVTRGVLLGLGIQPRHKHTI